MGIKSFLEKNTGKFLAWVTIFGIVMPVFVYMIITGLTLVLFVISKIPIPGLADMSEGNSRALAIILNILCIAVSFLASYKLWKSYKRHFLTASSKE